MPSLSPAPRKKVYLAEVVGSGKDADPYRPALPEGVTHYEAFIPTDRKGRPISYVCPVRSEEELPLKRAELQDCLQLFPHDDYLVAAVERFVTGSHEAKKKLCEWMWEDMYIKGRLDLKDLNRLKEQLRS